MGIVQMGAPRDLILQLQYAFGYRSFIETGTFQGDTALWAGQRFDNVWTIEAQEAIYQAARKRWPDGNIHWTLGDTRSALPKVLDQLDSDAIFWLDAHWSGGDTFGEAAQDECPLLDELAMIRSDARDHVILIEGARLFLSPPQRPHRIASWPTITQVIDALRTASNPYIVVHDDVIIAVPQKAKNLVARYCQEANTHAWMARCARQNARPSESLPRRLAGMLRLTGQDKAAA
ncbi:MAG: hypothetical protein RLN76_06915 [Phycisphaeraceae bacterium]